MSRSLAAADLSPPECARVSVPRRVLTLVEEAESVLRWYGLYKLVRLLRRRPVPQSAVGLRYQEREQRAAQQRLRLFELERGSRPAVTRR